VLIEPGFRLQEQTRLWGFIYILLLLLFAGCALITGKGLRAVNQTGLSGKSSLKTTPGPGTGRVGWPQRLRWIFWAFIPSSLMLGITTYLTTDIASVPLLWTVPLSIYLLTFTLAFNRKQIIPLKGLMRVLPISAVVLVFVMLAKSHELAWLQIGVHLAFFSCAALAWDTRLANDRPASQSLTDFYLCLSVGGVLGGLFNALLAPLLFHTVAEYSLMIALACVRWPEKQNESLKFRAFWTGLIWPAGIGLLTVGLVVTVPHLGLEPHLRTMAVFGVPVILCYFVSKQERSLQFALAIGAVLAGSHFYTASQGRTLLTERNFFGTLRVTLDPTGRIYSLYHGTTVHGMQFVEPQRQSEPLAYYYRSGPCGQAMNAFNQRSGMTNVAVIGLGTGAMACYAMPWQRWTFYEINPSVIRLARESSYFTYLRRCTNAVVDFKVGDARLRLREAAPRQFDLLVCDAFGSDAPPLHLLNREAMELYLAKLSEQGVLLFHISSRYLDFQPVLANLANYFQLQAFVGSEDNLSEEMLREGKLPSIWVALARRPEDLGRLETDSHWRPLVPASAMRLWTDDYSDILGIFQWQ
jgi:SAM-dependent methyltransferase